ITAIVGNSGSGKTTLMKLLLGFYQPVIGEVLVNHKNMGTISPTRWRQQCGTVMQEGYIFNDTIKRNIALDGNDINARMLKRAIDVSNIDEFVGQLPLGYNSRIGSTGLGLSGGQKQRILIARAVYKNPEYLFFDEATSSLDANNEQIIIENLHQFFEGKTVVVIAHRLSTVKHADQIVVLDKGEIQEIGTHETLTNSRGKYFDLVKNQLELA
ncbi:MAG: ATP-binding cassette domain-containing protein, partial [Chitinophagaceae bacterium]